MFSKLKEKLKDALSIFSRKTEEVAVERKVEKVVEKKVEKVAEKKVEKVSEKKVEKIVEKVLEKAPIKKPEGKKAITEKKPVIAEKKKPKVEEKKEEKKEKQKVESAVSPKAVEKKKEIIQPQTEPEKKQEVPQKSLFGRLKEKFTGREELTEIPKEEKTQTQQEIRALKPKHPEEKKQEVEQKKIEEEPEDKGFFTKFKEVFTTKTIGAEKFEELFWELEVTLLENNVSVEVIERIKEDLEKELVEKPLPRDVQGKIEDTLRQTMLEILSLDREDTIAKIKSKSTKPFIIAFFGINGSGKTTSIAKFTHLLRKNGLSVVMAACDTFRAAAIQQLEEHANRLGVKMIKHDYGSDAAAVAFDAVRYAQKNKVDVVLIDTAGRLHSNSNLMAELEKIIRVVKPDMKIFVGESITGNDCIEQARRFNELVEMDGIILTKADVDEKGGAPLSISYVIKKPILYMGVGQRYEDLEEFDAKVMLGRLGL